MSKSTAASRTSAQGNKQDDMFIRAFAKRFNRFCNRVGLSRAAAAAALGVSERTILRWSQEASPVAPKFGHIRQIYKISEEFGLWPELFLDSTKVAILRSVQESEADLGVDRFFLRLTIRQDGIDRAELLQDVLQIISSHEGELCRINGPVPNREVIPGMEAREIPGTELIGMAVRLKGQETVSAVIRQISQLNAVDRVEVPDAEAKIAFAYRKPVDTDA